MTAIPVPTTDLLWLNLHKRNVRKIDGKQDTKHINIDIIVEGITEGKTWQCGLEFDYDNEESFYCRPVRLSNDKNPDRMPVPNFLHNLRVAFLPPMSGLSDREFVKLEGEVNFLLGQGKTADLLRNLCFQLFRNHNKSWNHVKEQIEKLFGALLLDPIFLPERSEIVIHYRVRSGTQLDLSSAGRGMQQTLLLLTFLCLNPSSILLLDEPDAHLEILRQRQIYELLTETTQLHSSQVIIASHSEVLLNEAAGRDMVVAFLGKPHRIDDRGSQLLKSLKEIGFEDYHQAEQTGFVIYLEGSTDLSILRVFADCLNHPVKKFLERPFVHYVMNQPNLAHQHFYGLREANPKLVGFALYDRLDISLDEKRGLRQYQWGKKEIENYFCTKKVLLSWAESEGSQYDGGPLLNQWEPIMEQSIREIEHATLDLKDISPWSPDLKATDFLIPLFKKFFGKLNLPNLLQKTNYHVLAKYLTRDQYDPEIIHVLDLVEEAAKQAEPFPGEEE